MRLPKNTPQRYQYAGPPGVTPVNTAVPGKVGIRIPHCVLCGREHWHGPHSADGLVLAHCRNANGATYRIVLEGAS